MEKKNDLRVVKTQKLIYNAFFELMNEIGFSKINVQKIIVRAQINRSTFYAHYLDKFDLLDKVEQELLLFLKDMTYDVPSDFITKQGFDNEILIGKIKREIYYLHDNSEVFMLLMSDKGDPAFIYKLSELIKTVWAEQKIVEMLSIPQSYALAALIGMTTNLIAEWVKSGFRETPEEFVQIVIKIMKDIPKNIFD
jgi:Transcriptional regulator